MVTIKQIKNKLNLEDIEKPAMIVDTSVIKEKYENLKNLIPGVKVFYAVKTNPHKNILKQLYELGSGFEISSLQELKQMKDLGVPAEKIITGNTLKVPKFIKEAYDYGINYYAFDSKVEVDKIAKLAPKANVALRLAVDNTGSEWPLSKKFGAPTSRAIDLLAYAKEKGLNPSGLTFHVGSQCMNPVNWSNALMTLAEVYNLAKKNDFKITTINLGGGFPSRLTKDIPKIETIKKNINKTIEEVFNGNGLNFYIEPGRGIVGESAIFIATVIARANRGSENWLSLDIGVYNGLLDAVAGIKFEIISEKEINNIHDKDEMISYHVSGPTCDSWDTITDSYMLPKNLDIGDIIYILNTGAYTTSISTNFNGFGPPKIYFI